MTTVRRVQADDAGSDQPSSSVGSACTAIYWPQSGMTPDDGSAGSPSYSPRSPSEYSDSQDVKDLIELANEDKASTATDVTSLSSWNNVPPPPPISAAPWRQNLLGLLGGHATRASVDSRPLGFGNFHVTFDTSNTPSRDTRVFGQTNVPESHASDARNCNVSDGASSRKDSRSGLGSATTPSMSKPAGNRHGEDHSSITDVARMDLLSDMIQRLKAENDIRAVDIATGLPVHPPRAAYSPLSWSLGLPSRLSLVSAVPLNCTFPRGQGIPTLLTDTGAQGYASTDAGPAPPEQPTTTRYPINLPPTTNGRSQSPEQDQFLMDDIDGPHTDYEHTDQPIAKMDERERIKRPWATITLAAPEPRYIPEDCTRTPPDEVPFMLVGSRTMALDRPVDMRWNLRLADLGPPPLEPYPKGPPLSNDIAYLYVDNRVWMRTPEERRMLAQFEENYREYLKPYWWEVGLARAEHFWLSRDRFRNSESFYIRAQRSFAGWIGRLISFGYSGILFQLEPIAGPLLHGSSRRGLCLISQLWTTTELPNFRFGVAYDVKERMQLLRQGGRCVKQRALELDREWQDVVHEFHKLHGFVMPTGKRQIEEDPIICYSAKARRLSSPDSSRERSPDGQPGPSGISGHERSAAPEASGFRPRSISFTPGTADGPRDDGIYREGAPRSGRPVNASFSISTHAEQTNGDSIRTQGNTMAGRPSLGTEARGRTGQRNSQPRVNASGSRSQGPYGASPGMQERYRESRIRDQAARRAAQIFGRRLERDNVGRRPTLGQWLASVLSGGRSSSESSTKSSLDSQRPRSSNEENPRQDQGAQRPSAMPDPNAALLRTSELRNWADRGWPSVSVDEALTPGRTPPPRRIVFPNPFKDRSYANSKVGEPSNRDGSGDSGPSASSSAGPSVRDNSGPHRSPGNRRKFSTNSAVPLQQSPETSHLRSMAAIFQEFQEEMENSSNEDGELDGRDANEPQDSNDTHDENPADTTVPSSDDGDAASPDPRRSMLEIYEGLSADRDDLSDGGSSEEPSSGSNSPPETSTPDQVTISFFGTTRDITYLRLTPTFVEYIRSQPEQIRQDMITHEDRKQAARNARRDNTLEGLRLVIPENDDAREDDATSHDVRRSSSMISPMDPSRNENLPSTASTSAWRELLGGATASAEHGQAVLLPQGAGHSGNVGARRDTGTVVGEVEVSDDELSEDMLEGRRSLKGKGRAVEYQREQRDSQSDGGAIA
ncbi:Hypothetical predicted protein [Lecanosticta acicola]|uniref:Uncharacterized protein n=1 Tax=Lecanosticta acicola TaxID=111012 RepID=A0AAI9E7F2_9PEZI|nr:Hypothetical predicted protein [Lecanosticta acicola]